MNNMFILGFAVGAFLGMVVTLLVVMVHMMGNN